MVVARVPAVLIARAPAGIAETVVLALGLSIRHVTGGAGQPLTVDTSAQWHARGGRVAQPSGRRRGDPQ